MLLFLLHLSLVEDILAKEEPFGRTGTEEAPNPFRNEPSQNGGDGKCIIC